MVVMFDRLRTEPVYNTRAVVQRTAVPADTFRAWERRYGLPAPHRTTGNQRLYSERDIAIISWLRDQTRNGLTISQAVALFRAEESTPSRPPAPRRDDDVGAATRAKETSQPADRSRQDDPYRDARERIVDALLAFDAAGADRVVEEAFALLPVESVCLHVLQEVLTETGDRWQRGEATVGAEHFASGFVHRKLMALFNMSQPAAGHESIVAACVEGELHEIGLLLTCLYLSRRGYRIVYLGANLPLPDLIDAVTRTRPAMVVLSATTSAAAKRLKGDVSALNQSFPTSPYEHYEPVVGYGGRVFIENPEMQDAIAASFLGRSANEVTVEVDRLLARRPVH